MALPGLNRGPRTPVPPQTVVHKRLLDSEASQSCKSTAVTICTTCHNINKQCSLLNRLTYDCIYIYIYIYIYTYRLSQEECARLRESVPYVKLYRYNPKHLCPKLNGYGDNGQRTVWASLVSTYCTPSVSSYLSNAPARQLDMVMQWPWPVRYSARWLWRHKITDQLRPA